MKTQTTLKSSKKILKPVQILKCHFSLMTLVYLPEINFCVCFFPCYFLG